MVVANRAERATGRHVGVGGALGGDQQREEVAHRQVFETGCAPHRERFATLASDGVEHGVEGHALDDPIQRDGLYLGVDVEGGVPVDVDKHSG